MSCSRQCFDEKDEWFGHDDCHTCPGRDDGRKPGFQPSDSDTMFWQVTERFAALVAAHEREACAKVLLDDALALTFQTFGQYRTALAAAIRARGKK